MSLFSGVTTKDVLAVMVVGAVLVFNGFAMAFDKPLDAGTIGMAGMIVGHYFGARSDAVVTVTKIEPLAQPVTGDESDD